MLIQVIGASTDTVHSHLAWWNTPRRQGGLGGLTYPLLSDVTKRLASEYEVLIEEGEDAGVALRYAREHPVYGLHVPLPVLLADSFCWG